MSRRLIPPPVMGSLVVAMLLIGASAPAFAAWTVELTRVSPANPPTFALDIVSIEALVKEDGNPRQNRHVHFSWTPNYLGYRWPPPYNSTSEDDTDQYGKAHLMYLSGPAVGAVTVTAVDTVSGEQDTLNLEQYGVDLQTDSQNDGDIDNPYADINDYWDEYYETTSPGRLVPLNNDLDNPGGEDDLVPVNLRVSAPDDYTVTLSFSAPTFPWWPPVPHYRPAKVWSSSSGGILLVGNEDNDARVYTVGDEEDPIPSTVWVEGVLAGETTLKVSLKNSGGVEKCVDEVKLTVWDLQLTDTNSGWLPTLNGTTNFTATITPSTVSGTIKFTLYEVSMEKGYCCNAGDQTESDTDLKFATQTGFDITGNGSVATKTSAANSATVTVTSYDYGSSGKLRAEATVGSSTVLARITDSSPAVQFANVPRDADCNRIADAAPQNQNTTLLNGLVNSSATTITVDSTGGAPSQSSEGLRKIRIDDEIITYTGITDTTFTGCTRGADDTTAASHADNATAKWWYISDDAEHTPVADQRGDASTRYMEYRGFLVSGTHTRTSVVNKDIFITDPDGLLTDGGETEGLSDFNNLGLAPHLIVAGEYDSSQGFDKMVSWKVTTGSIFLYCLRLTEEDGLGQYGLTTGTLPITPSVASDCYIYTEAIRLDSPPYPSNEEDWDTKAVEFKRSVIAHELAHGVGIRDQEEYRACIMWNKDEPVDWDAIPHNYCYATDQLCARKYLRLLQ